MTENDDRAQAVFEMVNRIVQTAHDVVAQAIACDPDDKEIVRALGEDKFDGNACIGAADNRRKR